MMNIHKSQETPLKLHINEGMMITNLVEHLKTQSLANILSLAHVRKTFRVTMDTDVEPTIHVHRKDGSIMTFKEFRNGLYYYDADAHKPPKQRDNFYCFVNTVAKNKELFTKKEVSKTQESKLFYLKLGRPGHARFIWILKNNLISNCPINAGDARRTVHMGIRYIRHKRENDSPEKQRSNKFCTDITTGIRD